MATFSMDEIPMNTGWLIFSNLLPSQGGAEQYANTIKVIQSDFDDGITRVDLRTEIFTQDIGLVYKNTRKVAFCTDLDCLGLEVIEIGSDWEQSLIDFGSE